MLLQGSEEVFDAMAFLLSTATVSGVSAPVNTFPVASSSPSSRDASVFILGTTQITTPGGCAIPRQQKHNVRGHVSGSCGMHSNLHGAQQGPLVAVFTLVGGRNAVCAVSELNLQQSDTGREHFGTLLQAPRRLSKSRDAKKLHDSCELCAQQLT